MHVLHQKLYASPLQWIIENTEVWVVVPLQSWIALPHWATTFAMVNAIYRQATGYLTMDKAHRHSAVHVWLSPGHVQNTLLQSVVQFSVSAWQQLLLDRFWLLTGHKLREGNDNLADFCCIRTTPVCFEFVMRLLLAKCKLLTALHLCVSPTAGRSWTELFNPSVCTLYTQYLICLSSKDFYQRKG